MAGNEPLPLAARRAAWDALWRILLAPPRPATPNSPDAGPEPPPPGGAVMSAQIDRTLVEQHLMRSTRRPTPGTCRSCTCRPAPRAASRPPTGRGGQRRGAVRRGRQHLPCRRAATGSPGAGQAWWRGQRLRHPRPLVRCRHRDRGPRRRQPTARRTGGAGPARGRYSVPTLLRRRHRRRHPRLLVVARVLGLRQRC